MAKKETVVRQETVGVKPEDIVVEMEEGADTKSDGQYILFGKGQQGMTKKERKAAEKQARIEKRKADKKARAEEAAKGEQVSVDTESDAKETCVPDTLRLGPKEFQEAKEAWQSMRDIGLQMSIAADNWKTRRMSKLVKEYADSIVAFFDEALLPTSDVKFVAEYQKQFSKVEGAAQLDWKKFETTDMVCEYPNDIDKDVFVNASNRAVGAMQALYEDIEKETLLEIDGFETSFKTYLERAKEGYVKPSLDFAGYVDGDGNRLNYDLSPYVA